MRKIWNFFFSAEYFYNFYDQRNCQILLLINVGVALTQSFLRNTHWKKMLKTGKNELYFTLRNISIMELMIFYQTE